MGLASNTRRLMSVGPKGERIAPIPVEFHFLSHRELYDNTIVTVDRHHSSAGEWVVYGDHHWYTVAVVTRPVYARPQELCLSFDCYETEETIGRGTIVGPPIDEVALEFGALLSLLVREPMLPLGTRRIGGRPLRLDTRYGQVYRPLTLPSPPAKGVNSHDLRTIICGLANAPEKDCDAVLAAARLYHTALTLQAYDASTAYFSLISAIECVSGHHLKDKVFDFDKVQKFEKAAAVIAQISASNSEDNLIEALKSELVRGEDFVWQKFRNFIEKFLPEEFWQSDELHPEGYGTPPIEPTSLRGFLTEAYRARSAFTHTGEPFPAHVEIGISGSVRPLAAMQSFALIGTTRFVPVLVWFERLTHFVLREYLFRVIAPKLAAEREEKERAKDKLTAVIKALCDRERQSLERLTRWTARFVDAAIIGPKAPNREWALDEASIHTLSESGLISGDLEMEGTSSIKNREIGEVLGDFFFGTGQNPLRENTILPPTGLES